MKTDILPVGDNHLSFTEYAASGMPILLAPGIGDLREEYRLLAPILAEAGYRPVAMDLRGHGGSTTAWGEYTPEAVGRDLLALARHLNAGPVWIVGCSMAAASAVWAAVDSPELVRGIVGVGPSLDNAKLTFIQSAALAIGFRGPWKVQFWLAFYRSLYPGAKPADLDAYVQTLRANLAEPGRFDALRAFMNAPKDAALARMPQLQRPALIVMGGRDPDFTDPAAKAREYAASLRGESLLLPESGHYPHVDAPHATASAILDWIARHTA
jgi:pimeloyl-ACP methyl ester carboxylesterase